ncbi:MAG: hypothetical protein ACRCYT_05040, partial [Cetobacterium sp.]
MKKKLCLILICLYFLACGKKEVINIEQLQVRNEIYYKINEQKGFTGSSISKYSNGQIEVEINLKDGKKDGLQRHYFSNGQIRVEENSKDGRPHGLQKSYFSNGQIEEEVNYKNGKKDGINKVYSESGQLQTEVNYKDGNKEELARYYYENKLLKEKKKYSKDGILQKYEYYSENGKCIYKVNYKEEIMENEKVYSENGKLKTEVNYKNGIIENEKAYYENEKLKYEVNYKDGKLVLNNQNEKKEQISESEFVVYYQNGRIKIYGYDSYDEETLELYGDEPIDFKYLNSYLKDIEKLFEANPGDHIRE